MLLGCVTDAAAQVKTTDSTFVVKSRPIEFIVNKIYISEQDRKWITNVLIPELEALGDRGIILGRATASPEGPLPNNQRLATHRRASVDSLLNRFGIRTDIIRYDVVAEDYPLLRVMMRIAKDPDYKVVDNLMKTYSSDSEQLKVAMKAYNGGKLWRHVLKVYFPRLRAVRILAIDKAMLQLDSMPTARMPRYDAFFLPMDYGRPQNVHADIAYPEPVAAEPRRELLSIKSNLLFDVAYMPGYDRFCPIPNVAIEYYPLHGHFTYGASFDCPWWQDYNAHKYFQVRNYQIHTRYYLRSGDISLRSPGKGAAFKGLYFSAYAHAGLYDICFDENRGWEGEAWGAGLGIGYVVPLGKNEHWRLEFGLQAGYMQTDYDPYQWLCPVDPMVEEKQYYYKWYGSTNDFKKRQHRYSWMGPTRLEITLSYDLLYRKVKR